MIGLVWSFFLRFKWCLPSPSATTAFPSSSDGVYTYIFIVCRTGTCFSLSLDSSDFDLNLCRNQDNKSGFLVLVLLHRFHTYFLLFRILITTTLSLTSSSRKNVSVRRDFLFSALPVTNNFGACFLSGLVNRMDECILKRGNIPNWEELNRNLKAIWLFENSFQQTDFSLL